MAYLGKDVIGILSHNKVMDTMTGDGSDTTLTLSRTPGAAGNVEVYLDGIYQTPNVEYTLSGNTITFLLTSSIVDTSANIPGLSRPSAFLIVALIFRFLVSESITGS